jgi:hypothetical protein
MRKHVFLTAVVGLFAFQTLGADAATFHWSYTGLDGDPVTASGTLEAIDSGCCGLLTVQSITGQRNGVTIDSVAPISGYAFNDNAIRPLGSPDQLTFEGLAFSVAGSYFNIFYNYDLDNVWSCGLIGYCELGPGLLGSGGEGDLRRHIDFQLTATPLPGALPLFATGLGLMAWLIKRRRSKDIALPVA